jgi:hypothetical protein
MSPDDKKSGKRKDGSPEPLEDLRSEWVKEDVEQEGRKPSLEEIEEDASEL